MRKILIALIFVLLFGISSVFGVSYNPSVPTKTHCNSSQFNDDSGKKLIPVAGNIYAPSSGNFNCEEHGYYAGSWSVYYPKGTTISCWDDGFVSDIKYKSGNKFKIFCKRRDDTSPTLSEITPTPSGITPTPSGITPTFSGITPNIIDNEYFPATDSKTLSFVITSSGSPITEINTTLEKYNDKNSTIPLVFNKSNNFIKTGNNFSNVDSDIIYGKNYRPYTFYVGMVYDEAGNSANLNVSYNYNVYAADIDYHGKSSITSTANLNNGTKIADGTVNNVKLTLKDVYGNKILKVTKANNSILRNVYVNVNYDNSLLLDQYNLDSTGSSVFIGTGQLIKGNNKNTPNSGIFKNQINGIYDLNFKVYTPTENIYDKAKGNFNIKNITASVSDITGSKTFSSNIDFKFKPLYKTEFNGELRDYGFLEGVNQESKINISKNGTINGTNKNVYLKFGGEEINKLTLTASGNLSTQLVSETNLSTIFQGNSDFVGNNKYLNTLLIQSDPIENLSKHYLSTHINYILDGKYITYNSDIIGKNNYHDTTYNGYNTTQVGIKVLGNTYSEKQNDILYNQGKDINKLSGKIDKSILRMYIRKNAYNLVKNLSVDYYISLTNKYKKLGNVVYYKLDGGKIKYSDIDVSYKNASGKTILIIGGDLVIDQNIDLLGIAGIMVLKDINGKGGNILIDDDVLKINSVLYADKVILPYDDNSNRVLTQNDGIGYFKNQLYIKGTVFSNNTIGGARLTPPICPFYITNPCDIKEAQKYDLNFIRRYFVYDGDDDPSTPKIPANSGSGAVLYTDPNYEYPLIIKYNPLIQTSPPPLFSK